MAARTTHAVDRLGLTPRAAATWALVLWTEFTLVLFYLLTSTTVLTDPRYAVYPFVWINVGALAVWKTAGHVRARDPDTRTRLVAAGIAAAYLVALFLLGGVLRVGLLAGIPAGDAFSVSWVIPGWGPIVVLRTAAFQVAVVPFKVAGYLALSYVLYARLLDATRMLASAVFGLFSCVGCTVSLLVPLLGASVFGSATRLTWDASTAVFLLAIATLYWSPAIETRLRRVAGSVRP